jgi:hypothetical protein
MKTELIKAERCLFGHYRYRLEVCRSWGPFRWRGVYQAEGQSMCWYDQQGHRVYSAGLVEDLTRLLVRALALKQCPPQTLPAAQTVPDIVEIGQPSVRVTYAPGVPRG